MDKIKVFDDERFGEVRGLMIDGEPWFVGKDVAIALGYTNPQKAIRDHVDEEDKTVNEAFTVNGTQGLLVNESGLFSLTFSSKLPKAREFKHWVTSEVLPTLRKTGSYSLNGPTQKDAPKMATVKYMELIRVSMKEASASPFDIVAAIRSTAHAYGEYVPEQYDALADLQITFFAPPLPM